MKKQIVTHLIDWFFDTLIYTVLCSLCFYSGYLFAMENGPVLSHAPWQVYACLVIAFGLIFGVAIAIRELVSMAYDLIKARREQKRAAKLAAEAEPLLD